MSDYFVVGKNAVREVMRHQPERIKKICVSREEEDEYKGFPIRVVSKDTLTNMVRTDSHQGVIAQVKPPKIWDLKEFLEGVSEKSIVIMLDSIFDPQNFGAILRASHCFGVDGVIWSKNRGVDLTPVVTKASAGASEFMPLVRVSNLAESVREMQDAGYFVVTAEVGKEAESVYDFKRPDRLLIVMGSEGKGVQPLIGKRADGRIYLPMQGVIDSLNVSQAVAAILSIIVAK